MEKLSLLHFKEALSADILNKAVKWTVTECDEPVSGHYLAYVGQGDKIFDVSIDLDSKNQVSGHLCDCTRKVSFCEHKAALLEHIEKLIKKPNRTGRRKKQGPIEVLLSQIKPEELQEWITEQFLKNKELELAFVNHFSIPDPESSPEKATEITLNAVKAVVKNKKKLDVSEVKKIVDLWAVVHEPILNRFYTYVDHQTAFNNFQAIVLAVERVMDTVITSSNRMAKYLEKINVQASAAIKKQQDDTSWAKAVSYFAQNMVTERQELRVSYVLLLNETNAGSNLERRKKLALQLVESYQKRKGMKYSSYGDEPFTIMVFNALFETQLLKKYITLFSPIGFNNAYNIRLIRWLMEDHQMELAEKYCLAQVKANFHDRFNLDYLKLLREIYTITKDENKLTGVLKNLLTNTFEFEDYREIVERIKNPVEKREFRNRILGLARGMSSRASYPGTLFSLKLMEYEGNYLQMIDYLEVGVPLEWIETFAGKMAQAGSEKFLKKILLISAYQEHQFMASKERLNRYFQTIKNTLKTHFTSETLRECLSSSPIRSAYISQNFMRMLLLDKA